MEFDEALKRAEAERPKDEPPGAAVAESPQPAPIVAAPPVAEPPPAASMPVLVVEPPPAHMTVVARNPQEMMVAQARLIGWATRQVDEAREDHRDLSENLDIAKRSKWKTDTLKRQVGKALKRVEFYEKVLAALEAGYVIIPNFPVDVFAIRTEKRHPQRNEVTGTWSTPPRQRSEAPAIGDGTYLDSRAAVDGRLEVTKRDALGNPAETERHAWATAFREVDFPFATAKPAILSATQQAMALRIFDDVGVSPSRHQSAVTVRPSVKGDPMVIGRILLRRSAYQAQAVSFLISWFIDTRDLP